LFLWLPRLYELTVNVLGRGRNGVGEGEGRVREGEGATVIGKTF